MSNIPEDRTFARIANLFDVAVFRDVGVLIAGCGSGGGKVALELAMSGIRRFTLFDADLLEPENVIRHVCGRRYIGQPKTDALADIILDRNIDARVERHQVDLMSCPDLEGHVRDATAVVLATDNDATRYLLNEICVRTKTPFVVGRVFTRGIGGEVFSYRPGQGGCLACLERALERTAFRSGVREIDLVPEEEREKMYGLDAAEIKDSPGLNIDISFITSFHTRFVLDAIARTLPDGPKYMIPIDNNYVVWGNRPVPPFTRHFQLQTFLIHRQDACLVCGVSS